MALTITKVATPAHNPTIAGNMRIGVYDLTFDNSYPNGGTYATAGEPFAAADIGFKTIALVLHDGALRHGTFATGVFKVTYDYTNGRFHVYENYYSHNHDLHLNNADVADGAGTRVNAGTNLLGANTGADVLVAGVANTTGAGGIVTRSAPAANSEVGATELADTSNVLSALVLRVVVFGY